MPLMYWILVGAVLYAVLMLLFIVGCKKANVPNGEAQEELAIRRARYRLNQKEKDGTFFKNYGDIYDDFQ